MCIFFEKEYLFILNSVPCFCFSILVPFRVNTSNYKMGTMTKLKALEFSSKVCLCQAHINLHDSGRSEISLLFALFMASFLTNSFEGWTVDPRKSSDLWDDLLIWTTWYCLKLWKWGYTKEHYCNYSIRNSFNYSCVLITWAFNIVLNCNHLITYRFVWSFDNLLCWRTT